MIWTAHITACHAWLALLRSVGTEFPARLGNPALDEKQMKKRKMDGRSSAGRLYLQDGGHGILGRSPISKRRWVQTVTDSSMLLFILMLLLFPNATVVGIRLLILPLLITMQ